MEVLQYVPLSPTFCGSSQANRPPGLTVKPTAAKQFASAIRQHKKYAQGRQLGVKVGYRTCKTPSVVHRGHPCREILLEPCHRFVIALKRERKKIGSFSQSTSKKISPDLRRRNPNCRSSHPSSVVSKALKLRSATRLASFSLASGTGECHKGQSSRNLVNPQKIPFPVNRKRSVLVHPPRKIEFPFSDAKNLLLGKYAAETAHVRDTRCFFSARPGTYLFSRSFPYSRR